MPTREIGHESVLRKEVERHKHFLTQENRIYKTPKNKHSQTFRVQVGPEGTLCLPTYRARIEKERIWFVKKTNMLKKHWLYSLKENTAKILFIFNFVWHL